MLTTVQKAGILLRSGVAVPALPTAVEFDGSIASAEADAMQEWTVLVENLFISYAAARAAKSLRDAEEARQIGALQRMAAPARRSARPAQWV
jgi:hypothetical protein